MKRLTMGNIKKVEELIQELFGEAYLGLCSNEEDGTDATLFKCTFYEKEK